MAEIPAVLQGLHRVKIAVVSFRDGPQYQCGDIHGYRALIDRYCKVKAQSGEVWLVKVLRTHGRLAFCALAQKLFAAGALAQAITAGVKPYVERKALASIFWEGYNQHDGFLVNVRMDINEVLHVKLDDGSDFRVHNFFPDDQREQGYSGSGFDQDGRPVRIVFWNKLDEEVS